VEHFVAFLQTKPEQNGHSKRVPGPN
jgi:hypothetical protein